MLHYGRPLTSGETQQLSIWHVMRSRAFWRPRPLQPIVRVLLASVVVVLLCVAIGLAISSGAFTRSDLLEVAFYTGLAAFIWHPMTAAFIVMLVSSTGIVFTHNGGSLLELAITLPLVVATCVPWLIFTQAILLVVLTIYLATSTSALTGGGPLMIMGIAAIAFLSGLAMRIAATREDLFVAERARIVDDLEEIAHEQQEQIADELHDGIAHDLTLILFHARALPKQPDDAARQVSLSTIEGSAVQALQSIQSLLSLMRDTTEAPPTRTSRYDGRLVLAVSSLAQMLEDAGISTSVSAPNGTLALDRTTEQLLVETAIEAVTNIIKHAPNSPSAGIDIQASAVDIELIVTNVPRPKDDRRTPASGGRGLNRAHQRLALHSGRLEAGRTAEGWTVRARVPISA